MAKRFSLAQRLSMGGILLAFLLCAVGFGAPFWTLVTNGADNKPAVSFGPIAECQSPPGIHACDLMSWEGAEPVWQAVRGCSIGCVSCAAFATLYCLLLVSSNQPTRFIGLGLFCFLGAAGGAAALAVYAIELNDSAFPKLAAEQLQKKDTVNSLDWAFFVFCSGVGLLGMSSIVACFSSPYNPVTAVVTKRLSAIRAR